MDTYKFIKLDNGDILLQKIIIDNVNYTVVNKENGDKLGIALVPNLKTSLLCSEMINDKSIEFNCRINILFV